MSVDVLSQNELKAIREVDKLSPDNLQRLKSRLADFPDYSDVISREDPPSDVPVSELRLVKAFTPFAINFPEEIPDWVPDDGKAALQAGIEAGYQRSPEYQHWSTITTLVKLLSQEGLRGAAHPDSGLKSSTAAETAEGVEIVLGELGGTDRIYPGYAVVEKQEDDAGYVQSVKQYGRGYDEDDESIGIMAVSN